MRIAALVVPLLVFLAWASWPAPFPALDPLDAEAIDLLRNLERGRAGAWEAVVRARNPRTVPALMTRASREELLEILHPTPTQEVNGVLLQPLREYCCDWGRRPHSPVDAFDSALQAAVLEVDTEFTIKPRGCGQAWSIEHDELRERLKDPEPGVRYSAAYQLWRWGSARDVPRVLGLLGEHAFVRYAWLEDVAERVRRDAAPEAVREGVKAGRLRELAVAAFLKCRDVVPELVPRLNGPAGADVAWVLGEIGDARAVPALEAALGRRGWTGGDAAEALGKIGDRSAVPALRAALAGAGRYEGGAIARALEKLRP